MGIVFPVLVLEVVKERAPNISPLSVKNYTCIVCGKDFNELKHKQIFQVSWKHKSSCVA